MSVIGRIPSSLVAGLVLAVASPSRAAGLDSPQIGSAQSGPVSNDAAAVWWNPGRLGYLKQPELLTGVGLSIGSIGYQRELREPHQYPDSFDFVAPIPASDIDPAKTGKERRVHDVALGPGFDVFFAVPMVRDRLVLGAGLSIPYAATLGFPKDGPQRFAGESLFLATPHTTLALGLAVNEICSIGVGVSYVLGVLSLSKTQDFGALDTFADILARPPISQPNAFGSTAPSVVRELDVLARPVKIEQAIAHGASFNVGVALQPTKKLALGLVYQHGAALSFRGRFHLDMNDAFFTQDLAAQGLKYEPTVDGKAVVSIRLPRRFTLGTGYQIARRFALDGFVSYVLYQDLRSVGIHLDSPGLAQPRLGVGNTLDQGLIRDWKGTLIAELNARLDATDQLRFSMTAGYHSPASPDATLDVLSLDGKRIIIGAGMAYRFTERAALLADVEGQFIVPRHVTSSDYDLGNGTYRLSIGAFMLHGRFLFGPSASPPPAQNPSPAPQGSLGRHNLG